MQKSECRMKTRIVPCSQIPVCALEALLPRPALRPAPQDREPIALAAGTAVRTLQEFLKDHVWYHAGRDTLQRARRRRPGPTCPATTWAPSASSTRPASPRRAPRPPACSGSSAASVGKKENCIVTVHLGVARGRFKTLLDADLFLPESWDHDRDRCREAGIPDDVSTAPSGRSPWSSSTAPWRNGIALDWLTFDEDYGSKPGVPARAGRRGQLRYVGEVPKSFRCLTAGPSGEEARPGPDGQAGPTTWCGTARPFPASRGGGYRWNGRRWASRSGRSRRRRCGCPQAAGERTATYWLIWARNVATGEEKYFVSNAPADTPLGRCCGGLPRWNVEHDFRVSKSEIGFRAISRGGTTSA